MEPVVAVAPSVENNMYKIPEYALNIIKKIGATSEEEVYRADIINDDLIFITNEIVDQKVSSINGQDLNICAKDLKLRRKMFDVVHHDEDKTLEGRKVFVARDSRIDNEKQIQNGMAVITTYQVGYGDGKSHNMIVLDGGAIKTVAPVIGSLQKRLSEIIISNEKAIDETNRIKAAVKEGVLNGAKEFLVGLLKTIKSLLMTLKV